jgi:isoleucyl-tRNA synthetase
MLSVLESKGIDYWWDGPVDEFVPPHLRKDGISSSSEWRKGTDTMDVWFDSGTSWSMLTGLRGSGEVLADVCVEGSDQHRGWFQSQLLTFIGSLDHANEQARAPYRTLVTHGMVLDESGKKMSKSLGNIIRPETIIQGGKVSLIASWVVRFDGLTRFMLLGSQEGTRLWCRRSPIMGSLRRLRSG